MSRPRRSGRSGRSGRFPTSTRHFEITIHVRYEEFDKCPSVDFRDDLKESILRCVEEHNLLEDPAEMGVIEEWSVEVEDLGE